MFKKNSVKKNYIFNLINQIFLIIVPLITTPYISRVLLADGVGKYSYTCSLANYFVLFASLGITMYSQREFAHYQGNKKKQTIVFWETFIVRIISTLISLFIFIGLCLLNVFASYTGLMWCWITIIIAQAFDITGLFQGNEEFGIIVLRNVIIKTIFILMIFILVKTSNDVWIYVILSALSTLFSNLSLWLNIGKKLTNIQVKQIHPTKHIIPVMKLFIPTIAVTLYTVLDKTLIGVLVEGTYSDSAIEVVDGVEKIVHITKKYSNLENGYYEQAEKIVKLALTLITSLATVMISRNSSELSKGNRKKVQSNLYFSGRFVLLLGVPITLGLIAIAPNLIPWFLGTDFNKSILLMQLFSPLVLIIGMCNVFGLQYLIPCKKDNQYTIGVLVGAVTNLVLNFILIPRFWSVGAVVASLVAEFFVALVMYIYTRKEVSIIKVIYDSKKCIISGIIMFISVYITQTYLSPTIINTVLLIIEGSIIYLLIIILLKEDFVKKIFVKNSDII